MISVIIPTCNEAALLPETLDHLKANPTPHEILVVDAHSTDTTAQRAQAAGARVVLSATRQRAAQMNLGAAQAVGDVLLFVHADTWMPAGALQAMEQALRDPQVAGGAFARRFQSPSLFLQLSCRLAEGRGRLLGWHFGDQALFARQSVFHQLGGYRPWPLFEDLDFSRRLASAGQVVTLRPAVWTSARRFTARGPILTTLADAWLTCRYLLGADPAILAAKLEEKRVRAPRATHL
ncbi:MAG: TIGR04283 family arsenosugar biosynthesis glycosyltransferase [Chloroflexi bacterium]|nr:TIGR04283 family arsenosugar biosynthesis glycosyltransferase [Chloroflexota bacterium]